MFQPNLATVPAQQARSALRRDPHVLRAYLRGAGRNRQVNLLSLQRKGVPDVQNRGLYKSTIHRNVCVRVYMYLFLRFKPATAPHRTPVMGTSKLQPQLNAKRNTRIVSATLALLGLVAFIMFTWNDSFEASIDMLPFKDVPFKLPDTLVSGSAAEDTDKTNTPRIDVKETNDNVLKVWEEITNIRNELSGSDKGNFNLNDGAMNTKKKPSQGNAMRTKESSKLNVKPFDPERS